MCADQVSGWKLLGNYDITPGMASFPERPTGPLSKPGSRYVLLKTREGTEAAAVEVREGAESDIIFVYPGTLGARDAIRIDCDVIPRTSTQYRAFLLFCTSQGRLALLGLILGVSGILIDGFLKVGAAMQQPLVEIGTTTHAGLLIAGTMLQVVGLLLVFALAVRRGDL